MLHQNNWLLDRVLQDGGLWDPGTHTFATSEYTNASTHALPPTRISRRDGSETQLVAQQDDPQLMQHAQMLEDNAAVMQSAKL